MRQHCHNLRVLHLHVYLSSNYQIVTEIVRHNPHLTDVNISATSEVLDVILEKCPNMTKINLRLKYDIIKFMQVGRLYERLSGMKTCRIGSTIYIHEMENKKSIKIDFGTTKHIPDMQEIIVNRHTILSEPVQFFVVFLLNLIYQFFVIRYVEFCFNDSIQDLREFIPIMRTKEDWTIKNVSDFHLNLIVQYSGPSLLYITCLQCELLMLSSLSKLFKMCLLLKQIELFNLCLSNDDIVKLFTYAPVTLVDVVIGAKQLKVSGIIKILQQCKQFVKCYFSDVIDDALIDVSLVSKLRLLVTTNSNLEKFGIHFDGVETYVELFNGQLHPVSAPHYAE